MVRPVSSVAPRRDPPWSAAPWSRATGEPECKQSRALNSAGALLAVYDAHIKHDWYIRNSDGILEFNPQDTRFAQAPS